jgi:uncharacterized protein
MLWKKLEDRKMSERGKLQTLSEKVTGLALQAIGAYRKTISPLFVSSCRFYPTCSQYAEEALRTYGFLGGMGRAMWRILRCNPFSQGGYDPVRKRHQHKKDR